MAISTTSSSACRNRVQCWDAQPLVPMLASPSRLRNTMYSLPGTSHWLMRNGCDGCHQQMVEAGNPSNAPSLCVPVPRRT
eukprot:3097850-Lingulodinium_polyedra.AAC.1